jgi:hypothetical protein
VSSQKSTVFSVAEPKATLCLLKTPFLLPPLMLRPIVDTLLADDVCSHLAPAGRQAFRLFWTWRAVTAAGD